MSEFVFLYSTFPDQESALKVAQSLVTARLAACVNLTALMTSVYEWEGKLEISPEVGAFIKTQRALVDQAIAAARPLHPYAVPCFLVLPIESGNKDYFAWARAQTRK